MKKWILIALAGALTITITAFAFAQSSGTTNVEVRVWEDVNDPLRNYISARPEGGSWRTLGTIPLPLDDGISSSGRFRYGDITLAVPLAGSVIGIDDSPACRTLIRGAEYFPDIRIVSCAAETREEFSPIIGHITYRGETSEFDGYSVDIKWDLIGEEECQALTDWLTRNYRVTIDWGTLGCLSTARLGAAGNEGGIATSAGIELWTLSFQILFRGYSGTTRNYSNLGLFEGTISGSTWDAAGPVNWPNDMTVSQIAWYPQESLTRESAPLLE